MRATLRRALEAAVGQHLVNVNAAQHSRTIRQDYLEREPFTVEEARKIVAAGERHPSGAIFLTAILLGMRQGEVLGLLWDNVDLDAGVIRVRKHLKREGGKFVLGDLKTHHRSRRDLLAPPRLVEALRRHRDRQAADRAKMGATRDLDLVFTTATGAPIEKTNLIRRQWHPFLKAAGVKPRPFHATRHTAVSVAFAAGVPISEISRTLGHINERTTQDIYQHQFSKIRSAAPGAVADALFGPAAATPPQYKEKQ